MLAAFADLGLDACGIQREAGIEPADLTNPDGLLPATRFYRMWQAAQRRWKDPGLGLSAGAAVPVGAYEVLDYLVLSAATLGEGLQDFVNYFPLATRTASYRIHDEGGRVACEMVWRIPPEGVMHHLRDYSLAVVSGHVRQATGHRPVRVEVAGPPLAIAERYEEVFGATPALRAGRNAITYTCEAWNAPTVRHDALLQHTLRRHAELLLERGSRAATDDVAERVRAELLERVRVGLPSVDAIARALGLGSRTLQRRLRDQGVTFAGLADDVRASLAREYLGDRGLNISEVAYLLGFSEPSAFSRAFRRWTGKSPQRFRTELTARV